MNHEIPTHQRSSTKVQKMRYFLLPPMEATADSKSQPADALQPWISLEYHLHQQSWEIDQKNNFKPFFVDGVFLIAWSFEKKKKHIFSTVFAPDIQFRPRHSETQRVGFLAPFLPLNVVQKVEANPRAS